MIVKNMGPAFLDGLGLVANFDRESIATFMNGCFGRHIIKALLSKYDIL
jgi:hypothetical protein